MYCKFVSESEVIPCPENGKITVPCAERDVETMVFNLPSYLDNNPEIAIVNGYKPLVGDAAPTETGYHAVYTDGGTAITCAWQADGGME